MAKQVQNRKGFFDLSPELRRGIYNHCLIEQRVCSCSGPPAWYWSDAYRGHPEVEHAIQNFNHHRCKYHELFWGQMGLFFVSWRIRNEALDAFFENNKVMIGLVQKYSFPGIVHLNVPEAWCSRLRHVDLYTRLNNCDLTKEVPHMIKSLSSLKSIRIIPTWRTSHSLLGVAPGGWSSRWSSIGKAWVLAAIMRGLPDEVDVTIAVSTEDQRSYFEGTLAGLHLCPSITRERARQIRVVTLWDDDVHNGLEWAVIRSDEQSDKSNDPPATPQDIIFSCGESLMSRNEAIRAAQEVENDVHQDGPLASSPRGPLKCVESVQGLASRR